MRYFLSDHLGSASVVTDSTGAVVGEQRYYPFGETRLTTGTIFTDQLFTGQRGMAGLGIYHYNARFYSPKLGRFLSADTIVPNPVNPQDLNRFSYVRNSPLRYTDPTGNRPCGDGERYDCETGKVNTTWSPPPVDNIKEEAEKEFIRKAKSPLHEDDGPVNYSGYGGCNTITLSCSDGHHPSLDSSTDWGTEPVEVVNWWGRPIYATEAGTVIKVGSSAWGNYVMVEHNIMGEQFYSIYAHLQSATIEEGTVVNNTIQIGEMSGTTSSVCTQRLSEPF